MKIFIDTNIFLDLILKRANYQEATIILNSCEKNVFDAYIADITLLNIDYIAKKQVQNINTFLRAVSSVFEIIGINNELFNRALLLNNADLEDNVQYICALHHHCQIIISNDKNFYQGDIKVLSSKQFIDDYIQS